jgi:hypothetical protein
MFEYEFYNRVSNFKHHYIRCGVEKEPATVACKKMFFKAERYELAAESRRALRTYETVITDKMAEADDTLKPLRGYKPMMAWIHLVLEGRPEYRFDSFTQEHSAEVQVRYMLLVDRLWGRDIKNNMVKVAEVLPLVPKLDPEVAKGALQQGPFDALDKDGKPWVGDEAFATVNDRMNLPSRRRHFGAAPPPGPPGRPPKGAPGRK